jgi:hypothetical protein
MLNGPSPTNPRNPTLSPVRAAIREWKRSVRGRFAHESVLAVMPRMAQVWARKPAAHARGKDWRSRL